MSSESQWSCARSICGSGSYRKGYHCAPLAQGHHDGRVALHRLLHDLRGAEAAPDDLVAAERVHVDNPEIDALTCRRYGMLCIALAIAVRNRLVVTQYKDAAKQKADCGTSMLSLGLHYPYTPFVYGSLLE